MKLLRKISLLLLATMVISCSKDENEGNEENQNLNITPTENTASSEGFKGNVKIITETNFSAEINEKGEVIKGERYNKKEKTYDKKGLLIKKKYENGEYTLYKYDDHYKLISEIEYDKNGKIDDDEIFYKNIYDKDGECVKTEVTKNDYDDGVYDKTDFFVKKYIYNSKNRVSVEEEYRKNKEEKMELGFRTSYEYDAKGNVVKETGQEIIEGKAVHSEYTEKEYNNDSCLIKKKQYSSDENELIFIETYEYKDYDDKGNPKIKIIRNRKGSVRSYIEFTYTYY